ncbi:MAG: hypothetical protein K2U26_00625, partial [Cyclobacteriaceae bacterium]|nr:hypothetical protein [Cyclobacteriaceae bacterium]
MIDLGLYVSYFLLIIALAACILLPLLGSIQNPKALVKSLMGVGGLLVLFGIGYVMSGSEVTAKYTALGVGEGGSKMIGA